MNYIHQRICLVAALLIPGCCQKPTAPQPGHMEVRVKSPGVITTSQIAVTSVREIDRTHRVRPTQDVLTHLLGNPIKELSNVFDFGLTDAEIDRLAQSQAREVVVVNSPDGQLILTVVGGDIVDVKRETPEGE